ncbi:MAG TPA: ABC transporter substrate-binding protein, partial [Rhizomicrobium sp.]|nr:ABC transporter substrate-binding protein [Rhizomicrobium sp.]
MSTLPGILRSSWSRLTAGAIVMLFAFAQPVLAAASLPPASAESFVQTNVDRGLAILSNHRIPDDVRREQFRDFLTNLTDIKRIAMFTLGNARRTASPADVNAFIDAFRDYAVAVYESRLNQYAGQSLKVTGATERAPGDFIVTTVLVDPLGQAKNEEPIEVDFRVLNDNGHFVVIDASVVGVWLAIEERDQFTAFLGQNNNNLPA